MSERLTTSPATPCAMVVVAHGLSVVTFLVCHYQSLIFDVIGYLFLLRFIVTFLVCRYRVLIRPFV